MEFSFINCQSKLLIINLVGLARTILCEIYDCLILDYVYACSSTLLNAEKHASIAVELLVKTLLDLETLEEDISPEARAMAAEDCRGQAETLDHKERRV